MKKNNLNNNMYQKGDILSKENLKGILGGEASGGGASSTDKNDTKSLDASGKFKDWDKGSFSIIDINPTTAEYNKPSAIVEPGKLI